jgi:DNA repair exonuclease SbcCD ATPase subunit
MSMIGTEIRSVEIQGFRAFGRKAQKFLFSSHIAAIWAPNSHGKTSLAEAFEFLLTGRIARRELMASTQDEFADALRNAHIPASDLVYVQAEIVGADDEVHVVRRTLIEDYGKRQDCQSKLEIDNAPATRDDLLALGIALAQPPLEAPVLAQHTLGYLFSARPQERASYFKALLEVTDLENLRTAVAALEAELQPLPDERLARLASAVSVAEARPFLEPLKASVPTREAIERAFQAAARALIEAAEASVPDDPKVRIDAVQEALASRRRAAFPVQGFEKQPLGEWVPPVETEWAKINAYLQERARVDEYSRRLTSLFREALALPALAQVRTAIDCPLCDTEEALTPERVDFIRQRVQETEHLQATQAEAKRALRELDRAIRLLITGVDASTPRFLRWSPHERRRNGFRVPRLRGVIGDDAASFVDPWIASARRFRRIRAGIKVRARPSSTRSCCIYGRPDLAHRNDISEARTAGPIRRSAGLHNRFSAVSPCGANPHQPTSRYH